MKTRRLSSDIISTLPQNIIENILCLVPIQDAVRTSILARNWRYTWTKTPKLVFNAKEMFKKPTDVNEVSVLEKTFDEPSERKHLKKRCNVFYAIFQVLLQHQGPIHEFTLSMNANDTCVEIDQIISHLSRKNTLKKLTLQLKYVLRYTVPSSVFSMHQLTDIHLQDCLMDHRSVSNVSGSLTSLYLADVSIRTELLLRLISKSPLLKSFTRVITHDIYIYGDGPTVTDLFKCLPVIEHLTLSLLVIQAMAQGAVQRELPVSLVHLKYLCLDSICFINKHELELLALFIRCSPNLKNLKLTSWLPDRKKSEIDFITQACYSDIRVEHLSEFEIGNFFNSKHELEFVKLVLARCPILKKVRIILNNNVANNEELKMCKILLRSTRASPVVEIMVDRHVY